MTQARVDRAALEAWGREVGARADRPLVLALYGPLGAGKSTLARAVARGAGVEGAVPSPTFNLVLQYETPTMGTVTHVDLYRLDSEDAVHALGWEDLCAEGGVLMIEWPERAGDSLPPNRWNVRLSIDPADPSARDVTLERVGDPLPLPPLADDSHG